MGLVPPPPPAQPGRGRRASTRPAPLNPRSAFLELLFAALLLIAFAALSRGEEAAPLGPAADPLSADTFGNVYLWREVMWSSDAGRAEGWGGRGIAQVGIGRLGLTVRGDIGGLPESFSISEPSTFTSAGLYFAAHYNVIRRGGATLGVTALAGRAVNIEDGEPSKAPTAGAYTAGAGVRVAAGDAAGYLAIGTHEALGGFGILGTLHLPLTSQLALVADGAVRDGGQTYVRLGVAVSLARGGQ